MPWAFTHRVTNKVTDKTPQSKHHIALVLDLEIMTPFYLTKTVNTVEVRSPTPIDGCGTKSEIGEV